MLIALPGYWCAIALVDRVGRYWLTQMGFLLSAVCFSILAGGYFSTLRTAGNGGGFVFVYGMTYFFGACWLGDGSRGLGGGGRGMNDVVRGCVASV